MTRLAVIIVNYRAGQLLLDCLESLVHQLPDESQVYVVDNASDDPVLAVAERRHPTVEIVRNPVNVGFARANNQVLGRVRAQYYLLLNPDARLEADAVRIALEHMRAHRDIGVLGARVLRPDGALDPAARRSFKTVGTYFYRWVGLSTLFPRSRRFGRYYLSYLDEAELADVDSVVGAFMFIRSEVIRDIGLLDDRFFMYCEDEDFCFRAKRAGHRVVYHPGIVIRHRKGHSTSLLRVRMVYHWHRSLALYHAKNIAQHYPSVVNCVVYGGIAMGFVTAVTVGTFSGAFRRAIGAHRA